jgi:hypothetical protein
MHGDGSLVFREETLVGEQRLIKRAFSKLYLFTGGLVIVAYMFVEARAIVFSGTDLPSSLQGPPGSHHHSSAGRGWFMSYHGGK